jgi:hypothetical protein
MLMIVLSFLVRLSFPSILMRLTLSFILLKFTLPFILMLMLYALQFKLYTPILCKLYFLQIR